MNLENRIEELELGLPDYLDSNIEDLCDEFDLPWNKEWEYFPAELPKAMAESELANAEYWGDMK